MARVRACATVRWRHWPPLRRRHAVGTKMKSRERPAREFLLAELDEFTATRFRDGVDVDDTLTMNGRTKRKPLAGGSTRNLFRGTSERSLKSASPPAAAKLHAAK